MDRSLTLADYQSLAEVRYQIRRFLYFSEQASRKAGLEPHQHQLMLALKGLPKGVRPRIGELAERLQISASQYRGTGRPAGGSGVRAPAACRGRPSRGTALLDPEGRPDTERAFPASSRRTAHPRASPHRRASARHPDGIRSSSEGGCANRPKKNVTDGRKAK